MHQFSIPVKMKTKGMKKQLELSKLRKSFKQLACILQTPNNKGKKCFKLKKTKEM